MAPPRNKRSLSIARHRTSVSLEDGIRRALVWYTGPDALGETA